MNDELGIEELKFLEAIKKHEQSAASRIVVEPATMKVLPPGSSRKQDQARQKCRRLGLAKFVGAREGYIKAGWKLTDRGYAALAKR